MARTKDRVGFKALWELHAEKLLIWREEMREHAGEAEVVVGGRRGRQTKQGRKAAKRSTTRCSARSGLTLATMGKGPCLS